ncbi:hypothetical protein ACEZDB_35895 [Streptacidiphilus sp. N1-3]|uniref:Uncharacterized protein n=1 Tax=Streptacidiphilus alkalitolerans TaxID=3342712 RepID=A0ABV6XCP3_9ACTN
MALPDWMRHHLPATTEPPPLMVDDLQAALANPEVAQLLQQILSAGRKNSVVDPEKERAARVDVTALLPVKVEHTLITGAPGSGRSVAMTELWKIEHADPTINTWVCGPDVGRDRALTARHDRYAADHQACLDLLTAACALLDSRAVGRESGLKFQPTEQTPLIVLSITDVELLQDEQATFLATRIAKVGPAYGVVLRVSSTGAGIEQLAPVLARLVQRHRTLALQPHRT